LANRYDALLVVGFGGPEKRDDVIPFLENVLRGRNVPRERMLAVAEHYYHFGGRSPINDQVRDMIGLLESELAAHGTSLPVYWGNRNWHPLLPDTVQRMAADGVRRALAFVTSAYSSYSGCRQYRENIEAAQAAGGGAPEIDKIRVFYGHPGFLEASAARVQEALARLPGARIIFTAHSIPSAMAQGCAYERQLRFTCAGIARRVENPDWVLAYQSRSGPPSQPWLEPDITAYLKAERPARVVIAPVGFLSDHLEILWDLDEDARAVCAELGIEMVRAATVGCHPRFITMIRELIEEYQSGEPLVEPGLCSEHCCLPARPPGR